jgi:dTDP-4-dehydrorhamnose reductase
VALFAFDIDGCADAYPREFQAIMQALRSAGNTVQVVTGTHDSPVTQTDLDEKAQYLESLGLAECYDKLVVISHPTGDVSQMKADYLQSVGANCLFDNDLSNAASVTAAGILVLVPWGSRQK